jgi:hypothetical protein
MHLGIATDHRAAMVIIFLFFGYQKWFEYEAQTLAHAKVHEISTRARRIIRVRSLLAQGTFVVAMPVSLAFPLWGFGLVCCALLVYLRPNPPVTHNEDTSEIRTHPGD